MTRKILHRWTGAVLWEGEAETVKDALHAADLTGADLRDAVLARADLTGADLRDADLTRADLRGAVLRGAVLRDAVLRDADLMGADLRGADLAGADLRGADLRGAVLRGAVLTPIRDDIWAVLSSAPAEAPALLAAIRAGQIDGSVYTGACACLVGTLARALGCTHNKIPGLTPNAQRPAERFFWAIRPGDTPETNQCSALAAEWVEDWVVRMRAAFAPAKDAA